MPKNYYRVMLGKGSSLAAECLNDGYIGADFGIQQDLSQQLPEQWKEFNKKFIPIYLSDHPDKSKISAGLACGALWTICKGIRKGDIVLSPDGSGSYRVGEVSGDYYYLAGTELPHRRRIAWLQGSIARASMSDALRHSIGSIGTVCDITGYSEELERLLNTMKPVQIIATDPDVEDPMAFAMENHLEEFLVRNWDQTSLSSEYVIFEEDGELAGQQYPTDAGTIDILAISKDQSRLLVIELKRGRASDVVVGQVLRYIGWVKEQIANEGQTVEGAIIAFEDDQKLRWALSATPLVSFYRYQIQFKLVKG